MAVPAPHPADWATSPRMVKVVFGTLLLLLGVLAIGHLYVLEGFTDLYLGLPIWVWLELGVVFAMLAIAWVAVGLVAATTEEEG